MFTALTITHSDPEQWELSDGDTLVGLVNFDGKFEATYMAGTTGDRFEGEELGDFDNGIDAMGAILEKFAITPHCSECCRAHGGVFEMGSKQYCAPCAIDRS